MFNKPKGCISARRDERHKTVMDYFPEEIRDEFFPVGRLDKDTTGFLIISNDGQLSNRLMMPEHHVSKTYSFWVYGELTKEKTEILQRGVDIGRGKECITAPCFIDIVINGNYNEYERDMREAGCLEVRHNAIKQSVAYGYITISEGKKYQIKRMFRNIGCFVVMLKRISIGKLKLDDTLEPGEYREIKEEEIELLID